MAVVKFSKQTIEPNPLEVDYWVDVTSDPYGSVWKYYNGVDWVSLNLNNGSNDDGLSSFDYYTKEQINSLLSSKADVDSVESKVDDAEFANVIQNIEFREIGDNQMEMVLLKYDNATVGVTIPMASETNPGMLSGESFRDFVKQSQLQSLYDELYQIMSDLSLAEKERNDAEQLRNTSENERIAAETNRFNAENTRQFEEANRVTNENNRITAENNRTTAEQLRIQAEGNRESTFNSLKGQMQTTIQEGQTAVAATEKATSDAQKVVDEYDTKVAEQDSKLTELGSEVDDFKETITNQVNNYKPIEINGNVTNAADEEDITSDENNLLKLKDRNNLNGMGYVILRKNKTFTEQLTQANTIYEIRYDFDLNGKEEAVERGSIIMNNGGSINNGTLVYKDKIQNVPNGTCLFRKDTDSMWEDTTVPLDRVINTRKLYNFIIENNIIKDYEDYDYEREYLNIDGQGHSITFTNFVLTAKNLSIKNVHFISKSIDGNFRFAHSLHSPDNKRTECTRVFENCTFENIKFDVSVDTIFKKCKFINCRTSVLAYGGRDLANVDLYINVNFESCEFHIGDNNYNNSEPLHICWAGFMGTVIVEKCIFTYDRSDSKMYDWIDCYDSCNVKIINCTFNDKSVPGAEGIISVKSHSYVGATLDNIGSKRCISILNNTFNFDISGVDEAKLKDNMCGVIWVRNEYRENNGEPFYKKSNVVISNNMLNVFRKDNTIYNSTMFGFVRSWGFRNLLISNNIITSNIGWTIILLADNIIDYMDNYLITNNCLYTTDDSASPIWGSIFYFNKRADKLEKIRNVTICNNSVYAAQSRSTDDSTPYLIPSNVTYYNNNLYDSRLKQLYGKDVLDYSNSYALLKTLSNDGRVLFQGEKGAVYDALGNKKAHIYIGNSSNRPTSTKDGFCYYDTTLKMPIYWNESFQKWINGDGLTAGARSGNTNVREQLERVLTELDAGLQFFDSTLGKPIYWTGTKWVDATGTDVPSK